MHLRRAGVLGCHEHGTRAEELKTTQGDLHLAQVAVHVVHGEHENVFGTAEQFGNLSGKRIDEQRGSHDSLMRGRMNDERSVP